MKKPIAYTRASVPADIQVVAANMREADRAELKASGRESPQESLLTGLLFSRPCLTSCMANGDITAMWGVVPGNDGAGAIWLLGTNVMAEAIESSAAARLRFIRMAKEQIDKMHQTYPVLWNRVDARNEAHVKWLQWMGFTFIAEHPNYGAEGRRFLEFCKVRN